VTSAFLYGVGGWSCWDEGAGVTVKASLIWFGSPVNSSAVSLMYCATPCSSFLVSSIVWESVSADILLVSVVLRIFSMHSFRALIWLSRATDDVFIWGEGLGSGDRDRDGLEGSESIRMAAEQMVSAVIAVMPGAVLVMLSRARHREEWSGSWFTSMRPHSSRCFFAWATEIIEEAIEG